MRVYLVYFAIVLGVVLLGVGGALLGRLLYLRQVRRFLVRLIVGREAVRAAQQALHAAVAHLAEGTNEQFAAFASDPGHEDRKSFSEVRDRMAIAAADMGEARLPKPLWRAADLLETAAKAVSAQSATVAEARSSEAVLDGLAAVDLAAIDRAAEAANTEVDRLCEVYRVKDPAVYGGGLYI